MKEQRNYEVYGEKHRKEGVAQPPDCSLRHVGAQGWHSSLERGRGTHHQSMPPEHREEKAEPRHCQRISGPPWLSAFSTFHKGLL